MQHAIELFTSTHDACIDLLNYSYQHDPTITLTNEYRLLYYVIQDVCANISHLTDPNLRPEYTNFMFCKRNTRHAFESFIDLYNIYQDPEYIHVLEYNHRNQDGTYLAEYLPYKYYNFFKNEYGDAFSTKKHFLSIGEKYDIAEKINHLLLYDADNMKLYDAIKQFFNEGTHPDIFTPITDNPNENRQLLKKLLYANFTLYYDSFKILSNKHNILSTDRVDGQFKYLLHHVTIM